MKKIVSLLVALTMGTVSFAQYWDSIGTPFTYHDIYGNTISLGDTLAAGKAVVIDYSATWCGPCWSMHTSGVLEAIHDQLGSQVCVLWVETESRNTLAQIQGVNADNTYAGATQGNWTVIAGTTTPVPYPIIDDSSNSTCLRTCASLYEGYVPSMYFIAPTGYYCNIYTDGFGLSGNPTADVAFIQGLLNTYPRTGDAPIASIQNETSIYKGRPALFGTHIVSVDDVTGVNWTLPGATTPTASGRVIEATWNTPGSYTVSAAVSNANGTATDSVNINVLDYLYFCGFDSEEEMEDWNLVDADGDGYNWMLYSNAANSGYSSFLSASWYNSTGALSPDNWLISPAITLPNTSSCKLEWYDVSLNSQYPDKYKVYISTTGNEPSNFTSSPVKSRTVNKGSWTKQTVNLTNYRGQTIYIAFRHFNSSDQFAFCIDGMRVYDSNPTVGIEETSDISFDLFPNPVADKLTVRADGLREVNILDLSGRTLMTQHNNAVVDMSTLSSGVYFVRVITDNGTATKKIVKK